MLDPQYADLTGVFIQFVHDSIRAAASRPQTGELALESVPDALRRLEERPNQEFHDCGGCFLWKPGESAVRRGGDDELPLSSRQADRYLARSSSADTPFPRAISLRAFSISWIASGLERMSNVSSSA